MAPPAALRHPSFRSLWLAGLISDAGDWMLLIALPIVVYRLTGSASGTALAFMAELAPAIVLAPLAGKIADRLDRRRLMICICLMQAVGLVGLAFVHGPGDLPLIYGVILWQASLAAVFDPAKNALLPTLLEPSELVSGNSLIALNSGIGRLAGGPLGGLLLAAGDLQTIVLVDAASFLLAAWLISCVATRRRHAAVAPAPAPDWARSAQSSLRTALAPARVRAGLLVAFVADIAQGIFVVLFILFVARRLHGGSAEIGLLRGVQAVGAIGGGILLATVARARAPSLLISGAALAFGTIDLVIWNAPALTNAVAVYAGLFILAGVPGVALETGLISELQLAGPDGARGRVFAALGFAEGAGQAIGMVGAGLMTAPLGLMVLLNAQGLLYLAAGLLAATTLSGRYRRLRRGPRTTRRGNGSGESRLAASPASNRGSSLATSSRSSSR